MRTFSSHGNGSFRREDFAQVGSDVIFEAGVSVWHPETIFIGCNVYIGHGARLKSYPTGKLEIGSDTWLGQDIFFHAAGGIHIGQKVGIGPRVIILTSYHQDQGRGRVLLDSPLAFEPVHIEDEVDIGVGAILLPGVTIGRGAQVGAGSVVTRDVKAYAVVAGNPARVLRMRTE